jgi:hypothetical protein
MAEQRLMILTRFVGHLLVIAFFTKTKISLFHSQLKNGLDRKRYR